MAAYWHPIKAAGEAALLDLYSGGRLEFGIGSGAYQREFDRMHPGLARNDAYRYMFEMLPAVKALWRGDYEHKGELWSFPAATSVPKPLQEPHPPIWIAARSPDTYDFAVKNGCNILSWPLTRPLSEVEAYSARLEAAPAAHPDKPRPIFATMRHTVVYDRPEDWEVPVKAAMRQLGQFENLFKNLGDVTNGFPRAIDFSELENRDEYDPRMLHRNLLFGTPDEVIGKLRGLISRNIAILGAGRIIEHPERNPILRAASCSWSSAPSRGGLPMFGDQWQDVASPWLLRVSGSSLCPAAPLAPAQSPKPRNPWPSRPPGRRRLRHRRPCATLSTHRVPPELEPGPGFAGRQ